MIHQLASELPSFKTLRFGPGLNIILADKSEGATDRQSRNGAGKTSLIELVHFLFGADVRRQSIFRGPPLSEWTFTGVVDFGGTAISVARSGSRPGRILVRAEDDANIVDSESSHREVSNAKWKNMLGELCFGLPAEAEDSWRPSFRSLFSLVARRQQEGAFQRPVQHSTKQQPWDQQVSICYLLGLDWAIPARFQELKAQERVVRELRRAARSGELGRYFGRAADLRTGLTVSEDHSDRLRERLDDFRVVPEYGELQQEANHITAEINDLSVENVADQELVRELRASLADEDAPDFEDLAKLYDEAGIVLPDMPRRRLEQVERFHRTVVANRRSHLAAEIGSAERRIEQRSERQARIDHRRRQLMGILRSGGALEHYTALREELGRIEARSESLRHRLHTVEQLERAKTEQDLERSRLVQVLRDDIQERDDIVREAILSFERLSESLYERAGSLTIADTPTGPDFEVHIDAERSKGITNMQIFCFDLMLTEVCVRRGRSPGFLIHDSHLFDGVDERQVAKALQLGAERAEREGFQYIVTLNSDSMPREGFGHGFDVESYIVGTRLTDAVDSGGLFGLRFS